MTETKQKHFYCCDYCGGEYPAYSKDGLCEWCDNHRIDGSKPRGTHKQQEENK